MKGRILNGLPSICLDFIRLASAIVVFIAHANSIWYPLRYKNDFLLNHLSHGAVVVFFVLSGFVIAHTTTIKKGHVKEYIVARFSRIYSVLLPSIIITFIIYLIVMFKDYDLYVTYGRDKSLLRFAVTLFLCNEIWYQSAAPLFNGPLWSLSYEFWYYILFAAVFYNNGKNYILIIVTTVFIGPKILLMMPIWLFGYIAYKANPSCKKDIINWLLFILFFFTSILLIIFLPSWPHNINTTSMHWADQYLTDWLIGMTVAFSFWYLPSSGNIIYKYDTITKLVRRVSDLTFPIYTLHFPILILIKSISPTESFVYLKSVIVLLICCVLGLVFNNSKRKWETFFNYIFNQKFLIKFKI